MIYSEIGKNGGDYKNYLHDKYKNILSSFVNFSKGAFYSIKLSD